MRCSPFRAAPPQGDIETSAYITEYDTHHGRFLSGKISTEGDIIDFDGTKVKFLQIEASECIPGWPDRNLPTLFVYRDDDLLAQCVGPAAFGGASFAIDDVEWELAQAGIVTSALEVNPHAKAHR